MDHASFDQLAASLAQAAPRRRVLGGLAAALGLAVAGPVAAKQGGNGKGKAHGKNKVGVCHKGDDGTFAYKALPAPALKGHLKHGDFLCTPEADRGNPCKTYSQECDAVAGACTATVNAGAACDAAGAAGTCDALGACVPDPVDPAE